GQPDSGPEPTVSLAGRFARGASWSLLGMGAAQGLAMVASIVTARLLGRVAFGELTMVTGTVGAFGILAGLGLGLTATKYTAEHRSSDPARAGQILGLAQLVAAVSGGLTAVILFLLAPWLAAQTLNAPNLADELRLGCILLFLNALDGTQTGALAGLEAFRATARVSLLRGLLSFPALIGGVWLYGLTGAVAATVFVGAVAWILNQRALRQESAKRGLRISYRGVRPNLPILWQFSLPALLSAVMVAPVMWLANAILVNQPGGYGELGLFNAANQWRTAIMFLPAVLLRVALPMMASATHPRQAGDFGRTLVLAQSLTVAIVLPVGVLLMFLSGPIMRLYGNEFIHGADVLIGVACTIMIASIGNATGAAIEARGKMWRGLALNLSWAVVLIVAVGFTASEWGARSLAYGSAVAYLIMSLWGFQYVASDLPPGMLPRLFRALAFTIALTAFCLLLSPSTRVLLAGPAVLVTVYTSMAAFVDRGLIRTLITRARAWRGYLPGSVRSK
ncbi:MAG TPA: oligosaccharide flippase family protein, partial [Gemmatimonadales bacterium]